MLNIALLQDDITVPSTRKKQPDMTAATLLVWTLLLHQGTRIGNPTDLSVLNLRGCWISCPYLQESCVFVSARHRACFYSKRYVMIIRFSSMATLSVKQRSNRNFWAKNVILCYIFPSIISTTSSKWGSLIRFSCYLNLSNCRSQ